MRSRKSISATFLRVLRSARLVIRVGAAAPLAPSRSGIGWARKLEAEGLSDIGFTAAGCLGFCSAGPLMVVYPEGIWYRPTTPEDIDEIVESHFKQGKLVERLVMILTRS